MFAVPVAAALLILLNRNCEGIRNRPKIQNDITTFVANDTMADHGAYNAKISPGSISIKRHLQEFRTPILVSISPPVVRLQPGQLVHVSCEVAGYPLPANANAVSWSWNDGTMSQPMAVEVDFNQTYRSSNAIWRPQRSGTVRCSMGDQHLNATIELLNETPDDLPAEIDTHTVAPYRRPSISISASTLRLQVGDEARVSCSVSGYKRLPILWSWFECPPPLGDGSHWPNRTLCVQRDNFAEISSVETHRYEPKQRRRNETIAWRPMAPGIVECAAPPLRPQSANIYLLDRAVPSKVDALVEPHRVDGEPYLLDCVVDKYNNSGRPQWRRKGRDVQQTEDGRVRIERDSVGVYTISVRLIISKSGVSDIGTYECVVVDEHQMKVLYRVELLNDASVWVVAGFVVCGFIVLCSTSFGVFFYCRGRDGGLQQADIIHIIDGDMNNYDAAKCPTEQAYMRPYESTLEFPLKQLHFSKCQLGSGAFGVVYRAQALRIEPNVAETTVAVKISRSSDSNDAIRSLISELKIMTHIGRHENVLRLLGAVTRSICRRRIYLITEFCELGNLKQFLRERHTDFVDQMCGDRPPKAVKDKQETLFTAGIRRSSSSPLTSTDLLRWSMQAANGMQYLVSRGVVHGDLAARNCLLTSDRVLKIGDFGRSRALRVNEKYQRASDSQDPLPIKWMAIEAIRDNCFSAETDVWSFGVLLWELFSLGEAPYAGLPNVLVPDRLRIGYRMPRPPFASDTVDQLMRECWSEDPMMRPKFETIVRRLREIRLVGAVTEPVST